MNVVKGGDNLTKSVVKEGGNEFKNMKTKGANGGRVVILEI